MHSVKDHLIRKSELLGLVGLSDSTIWRMERAGDFPQRMRIGSRSVAWSHEEIQEWLEARKASR